MFVLIQTRYIKAIFSIHKRCQQNAFDLTQVSQLMGKAVTGKTHMSRLHMEIILGEPQLSHIPPPNQDNKQNFKFRYFHDLRPDLRHELSTLPLL